jgi:hypothetical protein
MDQDVNLVSSGEEASRVDTQLLDHASLPFVGQWNHLVSNTNWEKGRIIQQWREALQESGASPTEYSDDAWSRRVGGVTGQHVGRLRRVFQRFGLSYSDYPSLYWSHFQAAVEWTDAEMWLEGAVQNGWSVSQLRHQRWETMGALEPAPSADEVLSNELDEDFEPAAGTPPAREGARPGADVPSGPRAEGPDFGEDADGVPARSAHEASRPLEADEEPASTIDFVRPFAELSELPEDLSTAFEAFKLAILHHKLDQWQSISRDDVLASLDALKQLVVAP